MDKLIKMLWENNEYDLQTTDEYEQELDQLINDLYIDINQFTDKEMTIINGVVNRIAINRAKILLVGEI
jgi:hypothetical protein